MKRILNSLFSVVTRHRIGLWCWDHTIVRASRFLEPHRPHCFAHIAHGQLFERFAHYTRLQKSEYCLNLDLASAYRTVDGSVVECGVWRGGMSAGLAALLGNQRDYYLFDSFEGLPEASKIDGKKAIDWQATNEVDNCRTEEIFAHEAMKLAGAERYHIVKGWFNQTLPPFHPAQRIAILRLDADWYSSTAECLNYLYEKVVPGGLIIVDDYYAWDGCARAIHDYLSVNRLRDRIRQHKDTVCYLVKTEDSLVRVLDPNPQRNRDVTDSATAPPASPAGSFPGAKPHPVSSETSSESRGGAPR